MDKTVIMIDSATGLQFLISQLRLVAKECSTTLPMDYQMKKIVKNIGSMLSKIFEIHATHDSFL